MRLTGDRDVGSDPVLVVVEALGVTVVFPQLAVYESVGEGDIWAFKVDTGAVGTTLFVTGWLTVAGMVVTLICGTNAILLLLAAAMDTDAAALMYRLRNIA